jgi:benzoylformate decarboxylase
MSAAEQAAAEARRQAAVADQSARRASLRQDIQRQRGQRPLAPSVLIDTIASVLPPRAAVVDAAVTSSGGILERLGAIDDPYAYFGQRGWTLGWGLNVTLGVQLAWRDRPVVGLIGDGEAMYGIQGIWSAAHYHLPVTWIIFNNANYQILKNCAQQMQLPGARQGRYLELELVRPAIDYVGLARALGVAAERLCEPDEIAAALQAAWKDPKPRLIEVPIGG